MGLFVGRGEHRGERATFVYQIRVSGDGGISGEAKKESQKRKMRWASRLPPWCLVVLLSEIAVYLFAIRVHPLLHDSVLLMYGLDGVLYSGYSQETERLGPPVSVVIFGSGGNNESCFSSPALSCESEQHRGHAHLVDL